MNRNSIAFKLAFAGVLAALSIVLVTFIHFPLIPALAFLEYDPADIPILITSVVLGPVYGIAVTLIVAIIQGLTVSFNSGVYGIIMHIISTGTFVLSVGLLSRRRKKSYHLPLYLGIGIIAVTAVMIPANLIVTPIFMGQPVSAVVSYLPQIILFNFLKSLINAVLAFLIFTVLEKARVLKSIGLG